MPRLHEDLLCQEVQRGLKPRRAVRTWPMGKVPHVDSTLLQNHGAAARGAKEWSGCAFLEADRFYDAAVCSCSKWNLQEGDFAVFSSVPADADYPGAPPRAACSTASHCPLRLPLERCAARWLAVWAIFAVANSGTRSNQASLLRTSTNWLPTASC